MGKFCYFVICMTINLKLLYMSARVSTVQRHTEVLGKIRWTLKYTKKRRLETHTHLLIHTYTHT